MESIATLASLKIDAPTPVPKTKTKQKQKMKNGGKQTKKDAGKPMKKPMVTDAGKLLKKPMATDAGKPTIAMTRADKPMKTDAGKCDKTVKLSHLMTVYLKTMKRKPGMFDDKPPKVKMKMECNCTLHQVTTPGKIWGQATAGHFGVSVTEVAHAMAILVQAGFSKDLQRPIYV